jgi:hypothetical protein
VHREGLQLQVLPDAEVVMPMKHGYRREKIANWKRVCAPGSIRTVKSGKARVLVCCPRSHWRKGKCKVSMRAVSLDAPRSFGGYWKSYAKVPNLTKPYQAALIKIGNAGIGRPATARKREFLLKWGLIRPVRGPGGTVGYEVTAKGWQTVPSFGAAPATKPEWRIRHRPIGGWWVEFRPPGRTQWITAYANLKTESAAKLEVAEHKKRLRAAGMLDGIASDTKKEHREHPWTTMAQARRIARDHAKRK